MPSQLVTDDEFDLDVLVATDLRLKWVVQLLDEFPYLVALVERHIKEGRKHG